MYAGMVNELCQNCNEHWATLDWAGEYGALALTHRYMLQRWCQCCVTKAQIDHMENCAARLPDLKKQLTETECG